MHKTQLLGLWAYNLYISLYDVDCKLKSAQYESHRQRGKGFSCPQGEITKRYLLLGMKSEIKVKYIFDNNFLCVSEQIFFIEGALRTNSYLNDCMIIENKYNLKWQLC